MVTSRRKFIANTVLAGSAVTLPSITKAMPYRRKTDLNGKLKVGIIGSGLRGQDHIGLLLRRPECEITCIAEPDPVMLASTKKVFEELDAKWPKIYDQGPHDYVRMLDQENIDAVIIATPWEWHSQMAIAAMKAGVFTGVEVSGAFSLDECWELVNTHEATGTPLFFMENVCYRRDVMAILNMVKKGLFGELIHLECGYQHDLRGVKFNDGVTPYNSGVEFGEKGFSEAKWRTWHSIYRNGDLYPTHGIGPVAQWININRGNRMETLVSMASKSRGLHDYILHHPKGGPDHPNAKLEFRLGDKVTTMIKCTNGETIVLHHDTSLARPYSLGFRVQGTKGLWMDVNKQLYLEGTSPGHQWEDAQSYLNAYDHDAWKEHAQDADGAGHGGMDWFVTDAFVRCALKGSEPPFDAYDAAAWMSITPLSEASIASGGMPQSIPDFTRGLWMKKNKNEN